MGQLNIDLLYWINSHRHPLLDRVLLPVATSGETGLLMVLLFVGVFCIGRRCEWLGTLSIGLLILLLDRLIVHGLQFTAFRVRPYLELPGLTQMGTRWTVSSFPSGHAHTACMVTILLGSRWRWTLWLTVPYLLMTLYSRPYLGMHYPSDVLAGAVTGSLLGAFIVAVQRRKYGRSASSNRHQASSSTLRPECWTLDVLLRTRTEPPG